MKKTQLVTAMGAVAGATFALSAVAADETANPFQADELNAGFTAQAAFGDDKEGSCGEGSCGEDKDKDKDKDKEGEDEEGSCGEGSCGEGDDEEGSCGEGSCGEGSCGEA